MDNKHQKPGQSSGTPSNDEWASLMAKTDEHIEQEYLDDVDFITSQRKHFKISQEEADRRLAERKAEHDKALAENSAYTKKLEQISSRTAEDAAINYGSDHLEGENNVGKDGGARTYSEWDVQPIMKQETSREYGDRLIRNHDLVALTEILPKNPDESATEYSQRITEVYQDFPRKENEPLAEYKKRLQAADKDNSILEAAVKRKIDPKSTIGQDLQDKLQDIDRWEKDNSSKWGSSRQQVDKTRADAMRREVLEEALRQQGSTKLAEDKKKHMEELNKKLEAKEKAKKEAEAKALKEAEAKALKEAEERAKIIEEAKVKAEEIKKRLEEAKKRLEDTKKELGPLVAINADFTHDKKELAHDYAERELNSDLSKSGFIKRIWKGGLFKKYYLEKYEHEIYEGRKKITGLNPETETLDDLVEERSGTAIERFVQSVVNDYSEMVHRSAGESNKEADAETTKKVRDIVAKFATMTSPKDGTEEEISSRFGEEIGRMQAENRDNGTPVNNLLVNNYYEVAVQARERVRHGMAIEDVMNGFKVYNAKVRNNIRTEAHRDAVDRLVDKYESSRLGRFIPPEIVAAAAGTAYSLSQSGVRALVGATGGVFTAGIFSGLRERNRVTEDRARIIRDQAIGYQYQGKSKDELDKMGHRARKRAEKQAKYEAEIGGTSYHALSARTLIDNIHAAIESKDSQKILSAIAEARVRIDYSDSERKDLIIYTSGDRVGDERLALDLVTCEAMHNLSPEDRQKVDLMRKDINSRIQEEVDEKDKDFKKLRALRALKQAGKTIAISGTVFLASQEIMAFFDRKKIGLVERLVKQNDYDEDAKETILAKMLGSKRSHQVNQPKGEWLTIEEETTVTDRTVLEEGDPNINQLRQAGYKRGRLVQEASTVEGAPEPRNIDPSESASRLKAYKYDGWANNGTKASDGNELRIFQQDGKLISGMHGNSTLGTTAFNYEQLLADNKIRGILTVGDSKFIIKPGVDDLGNLTFGEDGVFTTLSGDTLKAIGDNGEKLYKYFEIAVDNGVDTNGVQHIVPLATVVGDNTFSGTIQEIVSSSTESPAKYEWVKEVTYPHFRFNTDATRTATEALRDVSLSGIVAPGASSRIGLGEPTPPRRPEAVMPTEPSETESNGSDTLPEPTEPTGETGGDTPPSNPEDGDTPPTPPVDQPTATEDQPANPEDAARQAEIDAINNDFEDVKDILGDDGLGFLTSNEGYTVERGDRISDWWNKTFSDGRNPELRERLINYVRNDNSDLGKALKQWLSLNMGPSLLA